MFYRVVGLTDWSKVKTGRTYDLISCLNVLDRCDEPMAMLHDILESLTPRTGRALVAVVLPFKPYVEVGRCLFFLPVNPENR